MKVTQKTIKTIVTLICLLCGCQAKVSVDLNEVGTTENPIRRSGVLTENENWSGTVIISGNLEVADGVTLRIQPGTIVGFEDELGRMSVRGSLYAEGEQENPIRFISTGGRWSGILIDKMSPNSRLTYAQFQNSEKAIECKSDAVQIENCLFTKNNITMQITADPLIFENEFNRNSIGIITLGYAKPEIAHNTFVANEFGISCDDQSAPNIHHNELNRNYRHAIVSYSSAEPEISSNNIIANGGWAIHGGGHLRDNFIHGNNKFFDAIELSTDRNSEQFYDVDSVSSARSTRVISAGR